MVELLTQVEDSIRSRRLIARGERVLVAVSGGLDSMVLLRVLWKLSEANNWKLLVAHLNHCLRGRSSDADQRLVERVAKACEIGIRKCSVDVRKVAARSKGLSLEMAARQVRHEFLARVAASQNIRTVALAHHADDQVELFFLRLLRGSGGEGLAGMRWRSPSPADKGVTLIRPLLNLPKTAIAEFAAAEGIRFREDRTNRETDFLRNRIRNELLPWLRREYQPGLQRSILRLMDIVGAEAELARGLAWEWLKTDLPERSEPGKCAGLPRKFLGSDEGSLPFEQLPVAVQRQVLLLQLFDLGLPGDFELLEHLRTQVDRPATYSRQKDIFRDAQGRLHLVAPAMPFRFTSQETRFALCSETGTACLDGLSIHWEVTECQEIKVPPRVAGCERFDADRVGHDVILRHWKPGDRFQPIGMKTPAKLQDIFINQKILRQERHKVVLATTGEGEVFWVEGLRIAERYKLTKRTKRRLLWRWERL